MLAGQLEQRLCYGPCRVCPLSFLPQALKPLSPIVSSFLKLACRQCCGWHVGLVLGIFQIPNLNTCCLLQDASEGMG